MENTKKILDFPDLQELRNTQERNETNEIPRLDLEQVKQAVEFFCVPGCSKFAAGGFATFDTLWQLAEMKLETVKDNKKLHINHRFAVLYLKVWLFNLREKFLELCDYLAIVSLLPPSARPVTVGHQIPLQEHTLLGAVMLDLARKSLDGSQKKYINMGIHIGERIAEEEEAIQRISAHILENVKSIEWWENPENAEPSLLETTPAGSETKEIVKTSSGFLQQLRKLIPL